MSLALMKVSSTTAVAAASAFWLVVCAPALAQPVARVVPGASEVTFVSRQMGVPVEGRFKQFDAQIALDPKKPETAKVAFTIPIASASIGVPETDAELPKPVWFNAAKYPAATFQSTAVKGLGGGRFEVTGTLAIKGATQVVVVPVAVVQSGSTSTASGAFTIRRLDFRIGDGEWADTSMVANDVQVRFRLALSGLPPL